MANSRSLWTKRLADGGALHPPAPTRRPVERASDAVVAGRSFRGVMLGIDPSVRGTGLAVLSFETIRPVLLFSTTIKVPPKFPFTVALGFIHRAVVSVLRDYPIAAVAIEETIFVQNFRTAQLMGAARGAALGPAAAQDLPIAQVAPKAVKLSTTGNGAADKEQIQKMVRTILGAPACLPPDEADAAAIALTAVARRLISVPVPSDGIGAKARSQPMAQVGEHPL